MMIICYLIIAILLLIPAMTTCCNSYRAFCFVKTITTFYLISKISLQITMLVNIQNDFNDSWEYNICSSFVSWTKFWLIWNYIILALTFIYFVGFIGVAWLKCDYYDEYDFDY